MPSLALAMVMLFAGFVYAIFAMVFGILKSSEPYREAMARATSSPQVTTALGTPIDDGFLVSGNVRTSGGSGQASLEIPISGPQGKARIYVDAAKSGGRWTFSILEVAVAGRPERIDLKDR